MPSSAVTIRPASPDDLNDPQRLLGIEDVVEVLRQRGLNVDPHRVRAWARQKKLPMWKLEREWVITRKGLDDHFERQQAKASIACDKANKKAA